MSKPPIITEDQLSRLEQMVEPNQQTWDLSPNDVAAIGAAVNSLKHQQAVLSGLRQKAHTMSCSGTADRARAGNDMLELLDQCGITE